MDTGFFTSEVSLTFSALFGIALGIGAIGHAFVKRYALAVLVGTVVATVVAYGAYGLWRGYIPHVMFIGIIAAVCAPFVAAIGFPFHRHRTGAGIGRGIDV